MKVVQVLLSIVLISVLSVNALAEESREEKQARLDAACEVERQKLLQPMRKEYIAECVTDNELPSQEECEQFYAARINGLLIHVVVTGGLHRYATLP